MDHVAILSKAKVSKGDNLLKDILEGKKTIESRWYVNKTSPWNKIKAGDSIYFKESGEPVTAFAKVAKVIQYENLNRNTIKQIIQKNGKEIAPHSSKKDLQTWEGALLNKKYCILIFLQETKEILPFKINKKGYGIASAWLVVGDIAKVRF